jgi:hypothetical protein
MHDISLKIGTLAREIHLTIRLTVTIVTQQCQIDNDRTGET